MTETTPSPFVHLHVHSHYSMLDGAIRLDDLLKRCKEFNMSAVALTDHGAMFGALEFYEKAKKAGIKPLVGCEFYVAQKSRFKKDQNAGHNFHLVLLAMNKTGYLNLMKLASAAQTEGFYYKPRIDKVLLKKHSEGIICLSGGLRGDISKALEMNDWEKAEQRAKEYVDAVGEGNFFLELVDHPEMDEQIARNNDMIKLGKKLNIPVVATKDTHYLNPDDAEPHDLLICIGSGKTKIGRAHV